MANVDLVIYTTNRREGNQEAADGKEVGLEIDGTDDGTTVGGQSIVVSNTGNHAVAIYAGTSPSTAQARFKSYDGNTVGIDDRVLLWLRISEENLKYTLSDTRVTTTSGTFGDDTEAVLTFTTTETCDFIVFYHAMNKDGSTEYLDGKRCRIVLDGVQMGYIGGAKPATTDKACDSIIVAIDSVSAGDHTIQGQFRSETDTTTTGIDVRQLICIIIPDSKKGTDVDTDYVASTTDKALDSATFSDDANATLTYTTSKTWDIIHFYFNVFLDSSSTGPEEGAEVMIKFDGTDYNSSRAGVASNDFLNFGRLQSLLSIYVAESVVAGTYTAQGRVRSPGGVDYVSIIDRYMIALMVPP